VVFQNHSLLPWLTCFENVHLAVERVFAATENEGATQGPHRCGAGLVGLTPPRKSAPARSPAA
jgi:nitrate/nitrite transport system ATP-binding protein